MGVFCFGLVSFFFCWFCFVLFFQINICSDSGVKAQFPGFNIDFLGISTQQESLSFEFTAIVK